MAALRFETPGFAGYNVAWSPFLPDRFAVAGAANYGLVGNGRLSLLTLSSMQAKTFDTQDGMFDVAWSELHENQIASACGDGSIKLWDVTLHDHPIRNWAEHSREVFSLDWNNIQKELFASSSWDGTVKVWNPDRPSSIMTIPAHGGCVYKCKWSPHHPALLATASGDGSAHIVDLRAAGGSGSAKHVLSMSVGGEVLSLDWNKYRQMTLATGSTDRTIKIWDGRGNAASMAERAVVVGHNYAVRDVAWSPHEAGMLASASYDMSVRIWNVDEAVATGQVPMLNTPKKVYPMHKEFASGVAWSLFQPGMLASTSWDMETHVWHALS